MHESGSSAHFFLSANTPQGFDSRLGDLYSGKEGWKAYILKGNPGTGKSLLLQKTGAALAETGQPVEYIHSTVDDSALDAVVFPNLKVCVLDGTPPHPIEPRYPGVVESVIHLGDCWDEEKLMAQHDQIILFASRAEMLFERSYRYLAAAASLLNDTFRLVADCADTAKIERYATRIAKREFLRKNKTGCDSTRFLSGITPAGVVSYGAEMTACVDRIFVLEDDYGLGRLLLERIRNLALPAGYDVISCFCPLSPRENLEHLFIPELSMAFVTSNRYHKFEGKNFRHIHIRRFVDIAMIKLKRPRISFNRRAARELISEAVSLLAEAKANADIVNGCYENALDSSLIDQKADWLIAKLIENAVSAGA